MLKPSPSTSHNPTSGTGNVATNNQDTTNTAPPAAPTAKVNVEVFYVHPDHLGTPRVITASTALAATTGTGITSPQTVNKAVWRWDSDPFGSNATANSAPNENPNTLSQVVGAATLPYLFGFDLAFPGQKRDRETGKHYNYFRDYDPSIGRYVESDPIGLDGGLNTFGYAKQRPTVLIDPSGEGPIAIAACAVVATGAWYVYKNSKMVKCIKECNVCTNHPRKDDPGYKCIPPPTANTGDTGPIYTCRTYCALDAFAGPRGPGVPGSRDLP